MSLLTHGSLFAGIGGFDLGFERAGIKTIWQVEIDPFCRKVLEKHWPHVQRFSDIRERRELPRVDIITGGDPCQDNSNACRNHPATNASLGDQFIRIIEALRPRVVVRENPSVTRADAPWPWWRFRTNLQRLGYVVLPFRFRACCIGANFRRERLFLLAELSQPERPRLERDEREIVADEDRERPDADSARPNRWSAAPRICGSADGIPHRAHRIKSLGNAVVPQIAEWIGRRIVEAESRG